MADIQIKVNDQGLFSLQLDRWEWQSLTVNGKPVTKQSGDVQFQMPPTAGPIHFLATADKNIVLVNPSNLLYLLSEDQTTTYIANISYSSTVTSTAQQVSLTGLLVEVPGVIPGATAGPALPFSQGRMTGSFQRTDPWTKLNFSNPNDYASAVCVDQTGNLYAAAWNPGTAPGQNGVGAGHLDVWSATSAAWSNVGGASGNVVNQMCADSSGNIYVVSQTPATDTAINIYSPTAGWSQAGDNLLGAINFVAADAANNVYITGNFTNSTNINNVLQYSTSTSTWTDLGGTTAAPVIDMCVDSKGTVYALVNGSGASNGQSLAYYRGGQWTSIASTNFQDASGIGCDNNGNVYFNTATTIMQCAVATSSFTDLKATLPTFKPGSFTNFFALHVGGVLYAALYGYTGDTNTLATVMAYKNGAWTDVTPGDLNATNQAVIYGLAGNSAKQIYLATNVNCVYAATFPG